MKNFYKRGMLIIMFLLVMALLAILAMGQAKAATSTFNSPITIQQEITGKVTGPSGQPLLGVTVMVKNKNYGTTTNLDGNYTIEANNGDILVFSFIGYKPQEITVNNQSQINISLEEDIASLDEVQINAGYYNVTERERTGNISRVTAEEIEKQPVLNPLATLQGRMPGVQVTQNTGVPGGGFDIKIRGINSLRSDGNEPLYIVDGVPFTSQSLGSRSVSTVLNGFNNPLNVINPSTIESIEVLKDADATAIYGSRGANGVVLITTKKGKSGKINVNINASTGIGNVTRSMDLMNTEEYLEMRREAYVNDGVTQYPANAYDVNGTWSQERYTNWQEELIGNTANFNNIHATLQGGSATTSFILSAGHQRQTTVFPGDFAYGKTSVLSGLNHNSEDQKFQLDISVNYIRDNNNQAGTDLTRESLLLPPNAPSVFDMNGDLNWENGTWNNPLRYLETSYLAVNKRLIGNSVIQYEFLPGLKAKVNLGFTTSQLEERKTTFNTFYKPSFGFGPDFTSVFANGGERSTWIIEPQINWQQNFGDHVFNILAGSTFQNEESSSLSTYARGFSSNSLVDDLGSAASVSILSNENDLYRYAAIFGRLNYQFKDRYILNLTGRRDGSSRFGTDRKFANFGAVGLAWLFSEEKLFSNSDFLSFGKIRATYGTTGNDQIGDYQYLSTYSSTGANYNNNGVLAPTRLFNPDYSWETNKKLEFGLDLGFWEDRFLLNTVYFRNRSSNQLVGIPLPGTTGFNSIISNLPATVENTGWEFSLRTVNLENENFRWVTSLNLSFIENELKSFPDLESSTYANRYKIGEPLNIMQLYDFTGVDSENGTYTFRDYNADNILSSPEDTKRLVDLSPDFFGGLQNSVKYRNWELDFLFQFVKQQGLNASNFGALAGAMVNQPEALLDRWQEPGDEAGYQRYTTGVNTNALLSYFRYISSTGGISDASYIRLKNLSLSYRVPKNWINGLDLKLNLQGQNLLTITDYYGLDPENQTFFSLPPLRIFSTGVQINF